MTVFITIAALTTWWAIGFYSFTHWWEYQFGPNSITTDSVVKVIRLLCGLCLGPVAYIVGWYIHHKNPYRPYH